jgi:hypothetical protein
VRYPGSDQTAETQYPASASEELEQQLMGKNRFKALNRCLAFGPEQQVEDCLSSLHTYLFRVVLPRNKCVRG